MQDIWRGSYILITPDGWPAGYNTATPAKVIAATHPTQVTYFTNIDVARQAAKLHGCTVHRVEQLVVLQEKFSY